MHFSNTKWIVIACSTGIYIGIDKCSGPPISPGPREIPPPPPLSMGLVLPMTILTPCLAWSVLDCLNRIEIMEGLIAALAATSLRDKWSCWSYPSSRSISTSPSWQKEKNVVVATAHIKVMSYDFPRDSHTSLIFLSMEGVIGRHGQKALLSQPWVIWTPFGICQSLASIGFWDPENPLQFPPV